MEELDLGPQPLDQLMEEWGLSNNDLVEGSPEQVTHKQIQRARKGRRLTLKMMMKISRTLNITIWNQMDKEEKEKYFEYFHKHLFSYAKGYDAEFVDPNKALQESFHERRQG